MMTAGMAAAAPLTPRETVTRLDSLIRAGAGDEARALCTGQALRLLPLLIETEAKLTPYVDTALSSDTILGEKTRADRAALKMRSIAVFTRPVMGLSRLTSFQVIHLESDSGRWKVSDFEELSGENAPWAVRPSTAGGPAGKASSETDSKGSPGSSASPASPRSSATLLPISPRAPVRAGATRLRLRVSLRGGDSLPSSLRVRPAGGAALRPESIGPGGAGQTVLDRGPDWALIETRRPDLPPTSKGAARSRASLPVARVPAVYLASTHDLDLSDPKLKALARTLKKGSPNDVETARRIYAWVSTSFDYRLGATLFGTSREALRSLKGDCSEAAVVTAALLRAAGIPSRVTFGFATLDRGVFIGHAWAEGWLRGKGAGQWIGIDPALRQFPAGAGRVALMSSAAEKPMQPLVTNLMMRTLANLDIEILQAWDESGQIELKEQRGTDKEVRAFLEQVLKGMGE